MELESSWKEMLKDEMPLRYMKKLKEFLNEEKKKNNVFYPNESLIFNAFQQTPFSQVKVVIIGQDPYHNRGQAQGLCFSVPSGSPLPPSLRNIYLEMEKDLGISPCKEGCLLPWSRQGVLLLNTTLTVRADEPKSHYGRGWEQFTDAVVSRLLQRKDPVIFLLWGKLAQEKLKTVFQENKTSHVILSAAHPSPFSVHRGFFGCCHFSSVNIWLQKWGKKPIDWQIT